MKKIATVVVIFYE